MRDRATALSRPPPPPGPPSCLHNGLGPGQHATEQLLVAAGQGGIRPRRVDQRLRQGAQPREGGRVPDRQREAALCSRPDALDIHVP